jgi:hypothetical protein
MGFVSDPESSTYEAGLLIINTVMFSDSLHKIKYILRYLYKFVETEHSRKHTNEVL